MKRTCSAAGCERIVEIGFWDYVFKCIYSKLHGGNFSYILLCPEHKERITSGRVNDNDDTTNPDLVDAQKTMSEDEKLDDL